jgi:hypothetical protein
MNLKELVSGRPALLAALFTAILAVSGCSSKDAADPQTAALGQERDRLLAENQGLAQARIDNEEVQRLKKDNSELAKLRSRYQESGRLKKENEQLRQQWAKLAPNNPAAKAAAADAAAAAGAATADGEKPKPVVADENTINEGDEIMIDPKHLKALMPDFDWEKLGRKEPLSVRALMEKDGIQLTNVSQLSEYGLTNWVIRRAPVTNAPAAQPQ